ncbi:Uncharacterized membrane protein [Frankineae bacterium MT45]|nr:Uncharacterized membrane protein [Frankineae bacterium MT45]
MPIFSTRSRSAPRASLPTAISSGAASADVAPPATGGRSALSLAGFLAGACVTHFVVPKFYDQMVPTQLPGTARQWTYGSGAVELGVGALVAAPRLRRHGALAAAALFVAVFPANVKMAADAHRRDRPTPEKAVLLARLPLQIPLVLWALRVARRSR